MTEPDRIKGLAQAIHRVRCCDSTDELSVRYYRDYAEIAVEWLTPLIEADLRERLATEVEAACAHPTMGYSVCPACRSAARIVRGGA